MQGEEEGDNEGMLDTGGGTLHRNHISLAISEFTGCAKLFSTPPLLNTHQHTLVLPPRWPAMASLGRNFLKRIC